MTQATPAPTRPQSTPRLAPEADTTNLATTPVQRLQALVGSSPRVTQLKGIGGWFSGGPLDPISLKREISWLEMDLAAALATPEPDRDEPLKKHIAWMKKKLASLNAQPSLEPGTSVNDM